MEYPAGKDKTEIWMVVNDRPNHGKYSVSLVDTKERSYKNTHEFMSLEDIGFYARTKQDNDRLVKIRFGNSNPMVNVNNKHIAELEAGLIPDFENLGDIRKRLDANIVRYENNTCLDALSEIETDLEKHPKLREEYSWFLREQNLMIAG